MTDSRTTRPLNTCEEQLARMTPDQVVLAGLFYREDMVLADWRPLSGLVKSNSSVAAYYLRCGELGYRPEDGE